MIDTITHHPSQKVASNGIELTYDSFGDQTNPPLLLVMGLGGQLIAWDEAFCHLLAAKGFWVIRFDNRDIGLSTRFDGVKAPKMQAIIAARLLRRQIKAPYLLKDMAADTVGLLDALNIEQAHVVGISMGGMILQELLIHYEHRVKTAVSIMSSTGRPGLPQATDEARKFLTKPAPIQDKAKYLDHIVQVWRILQGNHYPFDEAGFRQRGAQTFDRGIYPQGTGRQLAAIIASGSRADKLSHVTTPTLVMHGKADPLVPVEGGIDTAEVIPNAQLRLYDGMGHYLHPELWSDFITDIHAHITQKTT